MKIFLHDYSGHPFQIQLSRKLAASGHEVVHGYCATFQTPTGLVECQDSDPESFTITAFKHSNPYAKYSFVKRLLQDIEYGKKVAEYINAYRPDVVISSNVPLNSLHKIVQQKKTSHFRHVFWQQDIYSEGIQWVLKKKFSFFGSWVGSLFELMEKKIAWESDHLVVISSAFKPTVIGKWRIPDSRVSVIENWAPLEEIEYFKKAPKSVENSSARKKIIYTGTLGYKHNPELLIKLAEQSQADLVVFSEGECAEYLRQKSKELELSNLFVEDWVEYHELPSILASADLLIAMIEEEAGRFCVPSKILTYMCAGRPILASVPSNNLSAQIIAREDAGMVVPPGNWKEFVSSAISILENPELSDAMGRNARKYAQKAFDINHIADRFLAEALFETN